MTVVLHISDPHFGTEQAPVADALIRLSHAQRPELLIVSGDSTQQAQRSEFDAARQFNDQLHDPAEMVIAGNHDIPLLHLPARIFTPYARYRRVFGNALEPVFENTELLVIGVKT